MTESVAPVVPVRSSKVSFHGETVDLVVHDNEYLSNVIRHTGRFFEEPILSFIFSRFPNQRVILDVGANIGNHARFFEHFLKPQALHCFEPFPLNFALLSKNLSGKAHLYPIGIGSAPRTTGIRYNEQNYGIAILDDAITGAIEVKTVDSFNFQEVTLLKIDVEGDDVEVIRGARETISRCKPTVIVEGDYERLAPELQPLGYLCSALFKEYNTYCFEPILR